MITDHPYLPGRGSRLGRCEHVLIVHGSGTESYYCAEPMEKHRDLGGAPPITEAQANSPAARAWKETARQRQGLRFGGGLAQRDAMAVEEQEDLAGNTTFIPLWLDPVRPSYEDLQAENARLRERDSLAITLIGLLRYFLGDHEAAGRNYRPYREWKALDDD